jgi:16S rRNA (adenine1518-N6/adenine1519-N6)-dimethyltransferase
MAGQDSSSDERQIRSKRVASAALFYLYKLSALPFTFVKMYTLKKSLAQHFLRDENVCRKIVAVLQQHPHRQLLEVGPGGGALTKYLLTLKQTDLKTVELDDEKSGLLEKTFPPLKGKIIHGSFLEIEKPFSGKFTVIGNFPYNISSQILFKVLDWKEDVDCMIGMFQKEVAQRVTAKEGSKVYGVISVLIQAYFETEYLFEVHEKCFTPPPKVKSAMIRLLPIRERIKMKNEVLFTRLVKTAFNQRRKTLRNAVKDLFEPHTLQEEIFNKRAEQLSVQDFGELSFRMK